MEPPREGLVHDADARTVLDVPPIERPAGQDRQIECREIRRADHLVLGRPLARVTGGSQNTPHTLEQSPPHRKNRAEASWPRPTHATPGPAAIPPPRPDLGMLCNSSVGHSNHGDRERGQTPARDTRSKLSTAPAPTAGSQRDSSSTASQSPHETTRAKPSPPAADAADPTGTPSTSADENSVASRGHHAEVSPTSSAVPARRHDAQVEASTTVGGRRHAESATGPRRRAAPMPVEPAASSGDRLR